ncbi:hypothetical protein AVEN_72185-1 [Araneus ventricosus]|uniref:Uncharacterized protein n=1 Tax=Araneus ventricosus TaxID=182803 RepID=A0A4Y2ELA9_ARAVE|nr:hypothetical protein AVEN_72185-1 [Araneus ventricosus]
MSMWMRSRQIITDKIVTDQDYPLRTNHSAENSAHRKDILKKLIVSPEATPVTKTKKPTTVPSESVVESMPSDPNVSDSNQDSEEVIT